MDEQLTKWQRFTAFVKECKRVLLVTRKPDSIEFKTIVKVSGLGIGIIGLIGFLIQMVKSLVFR